MDMHHRYTAASADFGSDFDLLDPACAYPPMAYHQHAHSSSFDRHYSSPDFYYGFDCASAHDQGQHPSQPIPVPCGSGADPHGHHHHVPNFSSYDLSQAFDDMSEHCYSFPTPPRSSLLQFSPQTVPQHYAQSRYGPQLTPPPELEAQFNLPGPMLDRKPVVAAAACPATPPLDDQMAPLLGLSSSPQQQQQQPPPPAPRTSGTSGGGRNRSSSTASSTNRRPHYSIEKRYRSSLNARYAKLTDLLSRPEVADLLRSADASQRASTTLPTMRLKSVRGQSKTATLSAAIVAIQQLDRTCTAKASRLRKMQGSIQALSSTAVQVQ